jgi:predicted nucleic acid-binding protein
MLTADTNLLIYAADPDSPNHLQARAFFEEIEKADEEFVLCELILVELYMQLRNPAIFAKLMGLDSLKFGIRSALPSV